ncbi:hypothetical protein EJC49_22905 [Aquibium carbonis]|uniref:Uncharacterized protein n=1 Tax=Aquibium carbonis TaxID=2495581 RepID=A0A429YNX0_9HYPH|nr:hypothetical protein [Aquibium carbonis]RST83102.1 hypothetical protein EJC49_22905 [Aquibium carbonis]
MRRLREYAARDLLIGKPLKAAFKVGRNAVMREAYCARRAEGLDALLARIEGLRGGVLAITIAFEIPWLIAYLADRFERFSQDAVLVVCDNSRTPARRVEIEAICRSAGVPYLALPPNPARHIDRSHGNALNWAFRHVVRRVEPKVFAFLDHDLFPPGPFALAPLVERQPVYGLRLDGIGSWSLWAGYAVFDFEQVGDRPLDFYPDPDRELFTGGRNWEHVYRHLDDRALAFGQFHSHAFEDMLDRDGKPLRCGIIDRWMHLGGASRFPDKIAASAFFQQVLDARQPGG